MAIFGLKSRKSYSSDAASITKRRPDSISSKHNLEASDVIGATPEFGQLASDRRGASHASDSSSLVSRNSSSMKKFFGSTRRKGSQSVDVGSSDKPNNLGSPSSDYINNAASKRASRTSLSKSAVVTPSSPPVITPSAVAPSLSTPGGAGTSFAEAVGRDVSGGLAASPPLAGPRPSELFAGKGIQWNSIDLTSRDIPKPTDAATTTVDMQKFLKERRQWIPTFKDSNVAEEANVQLPKSLDQFSFATPAEVAATPAGIKSLKDLEDSHKRKAALLNPAPLASANNGTIFEEAAASNSSLSASPSASAVAAASGSKSAAQTLPPPPAPPSRNQSFRTSTFVGSGDSAAIRPSNSISRKPQAGLGANGSTASASAAASRDIPQRRSSVRKELSEIGSGATSDGHADALNTEQSTNGTPEPATTLANARVDQIKEQAGAAPATDSATAPATATGSVRPSMDTAAFATPNGSQSHDGEHGTRSPSGLVQSAQQTSHNSATAVAAPNSPPRPPKNGQRTPSRQNSREPITSGLSKSPSTTFTPTEQEQSNGNKLVEKLAQAAPALQNVVPGTGAATPRDA